MKKKVAVLIDLLIPGGVQKMAISEVEGLNHLGYDASLVILTRDGYLEKYADLVRNIPHTFLQDSYHRILRKNIKVPFFSFLSLLHLLSPIFAISKLKKIQPDVIISHGSTTSLTALSFKLQTKTPYIFMIHDPMVYILEKIYTKSPLYFLSPLIKLTANYLEKKLVKNSSFCVVDSKFHQKFIKAKYDVEPQVIYLGTEIKGLPLKNLGDHILTSGRWGKGKNLQLLLNVLGSFPKTKLTVAGIWANSDDLNWFRKQVREKKLEKRVTLITHYKDRDLPSIYANARVWLLPHQEAFSISALEAASMGLPIIIPHGSGVTDLLKNKIDGTFPSKVDSQTFASALKIYLDDKNLATLTGQNAALHSRESYSLEKHSHELLKLIEKSLDNKPGKIIALEAGHVGKIGLAGGDLLLSKMVSYLKNHPKLSVVIPEANTFHWLKIKKNVNLIPLKHTFLDDYTSPWLVLANYLLRTVQITPKLIKSPSGTIIYSSTDTLPDVIPAAIAKVVNQKYYWIARIHHLAPSPFIRPGNFLINAGSALIQKISSFAIQKKADTILVLNNELKEALIKQGFTREKLQILGGGVDYQAISNFKPVNKEGFDAVYLGRIHASKGVYDLPLVWQIVVKENPKATLAIIGTGSYDNVANLKKKISQKKLTKNIKVLGFIPQKRLTTILKNSKVFLFCDHEAGWGLAVAEAMASGMPVVGWDIGILGSVFKSGFLKVPLNDIDAFATSVIRILQDKSLHSKLSIESNREAASLDWQKASHEFTKILNKIARNIS